MDKKSLLYIVVPCFNEEACIEETTKRLSEKLQTLISKKQISPQSKIVYVDDGSKDSTWQKISAIKHRVIGLKLAHNRGHQNALLAGLMLAKDRADVAISMDADLQDDIDVVDEMLEKYQKGYEIVYGVRKDRKTDTAFKRHTAQSFYKFMHFLGVELVYNAADYRLMSKRALAELARYEEVNLFLRGIVPLMGFKWTTVEYSRGERFAGESKYPLKKMLNFAWDGITSFSVKPLRLVLALGVIMSTISVAVLIYAFVVWLCGKTVSGWTFIVCSIWLVGGVQMSSLGIIGEYIGKIYSETKHRPKYCIEEISE